MDKISRLLEHSARYFGLDGTSPECWDPQAVHPEADATRRRTRRSQLSGNKINERDRTCSPMRRAFMGRR
jgi:hypothetical protein